MTWKVRFKFSASDFYFGRWLDKKIIYTLAHLLTPASLLYHKRTHKPHMNISACSSESHTHPLTAKSWTQKNANCKFSSPHVDELKEEAHTGLRTSLEISGKEFLGLWHLEYYLEGCKKVPGSTCLLLQRLFDPQGGPGLVENKRITL